MGVFGCSSSADGRGRTVRDALLLIVVSSLVFFPALGQNHHWSSREVRHAEIIREMAARGDYVIPRLLGEVYYDKPPVMHAPAAVLTRLVGRSSMGMARLPSAVAAVVAVLTTYALGRQLLGRVPALVGAMLLAGMPGFSRMGRQARPDMVFCAAVLLACLSLAWAMRSSGAGRRAAGFFSGGMLSGLATLAKGPFGVVLPALFLLWAPLRGCAFRRSRWAWVGLVCGLVAVLGSWALLAYQRAGTSYLHGVVFQPDLNPARHSEKPWYYVFYYVWSGAFGALPLVLLSPFLLHERAEMGGRWSLAIAGSFLGILSIVPKKRRHYLLPALPFLALGAAPLVVRAAERDARVRRLACGVLALSIAAGPAYFAVVQPWMRPGPDADLAFAKETLEVVEPDAILYCLDGAEPLAWVGGDYRRLRRLAPDASAGRLLSRGGKGYLVAEEENLRRLAKAVPLPPLSEVRGVGDSRGDLRLYRIGGAGVVLAGACAG